MSKRVVVDGSNLFKAGKSLVALQTAIRQINLLVVQGELRLRIYVDANLRHEIEPAERAAFDEMIKTGTLEQVPAGTKADEYIIRWAKQNSAIIVSNDSYTEYKLKHNLEVEIRCGALFDSEIGRWTFIERFNIGATARDLAGLLWDQKESDKKKPIKDSGGNYSSRVSSMNPACVVILVDQSISMRGFAGRSKRTKAEVVAECTNNLIEELVLSSTKGFGEPKPYFDLAIIGYGFSSSTPLMSLLPGTDLQQPFRSIDEVNKSAEVLDGQPTWIKSHADGATPMCGAFSMACEIIDRWAKVHPSSHPPVVINVTDGIPTDGDPKSEVAHLESISTDDGCTLVFNAHIAGVDEKKSKKEKITLISDLSEDRFAKVLYPSSDVELNDDNAKFLFGLSSMLPDVIITRARDLNMDLSPGARAFVYNGGVDDLVKMFKLGTPPRA